MINFLTKLLNAIKYYKIYNYFYIILLFIIFIFNINIFLFDSSSKLLKVATYLFLIFKINQFCINIFIWLSIKNRISSNVLEDDLFLILKA